MSRVWVTPDRPLPSTVMVTGGAGFIGSCFLNLLVPAFPSIEFVNLDKLTYAGNPKSLEALFDLPNYRFAHADLADWAAIERIFDEYDPDWVFHFAAETHVDRSIKAPRLTFEANLLGTLNLLEGCRTRWRDKDGRLFHHISTDEVFGSLGEEGAFDETTRYDPSSPYSASKAGADHLVRAYNRTYGLPIRLTNCSNNYGPRQFPEKLMPLMILNAVEGRPLPVYGDGSNVRDWLYVEDHVEAIWTVACRAASGAVYTIGGNSEKSNLEIVRLICAVVAEKTGVSFSSLEANIAFVPDRPGHDWRYAIDASKIKADLNWAPRETFRSGLEKTVDWYLENKEWVNSVRSQEYRQWVRTHYGTEVGS